MSRLVRLKNDIKIKASSLTTKRRKAKLFAQYACADGPWKLPRALKNILKTDVLFVAIEGAAAVAVDCWDDKKRTTMNSENELPYRQKVMVPYRSRQTEQW